MAAVDGSVAAVAAGANGDVTLQLHVTTKRVSLVVARTVGDCTSYTVEASTKSDFSVKKRVVVEKTAANDPANDPLVLDNAGLGFPFAPGDDAAKLYVRIVPTGGAAANSFDVRAHRW